MAAPDAPPQILSYELSSSVVSPGQTLSGRVYTSSNVASVEARVAGYSISMAKTGVGAFSVAYTVPNIPVFFRKTYTLSIIACNTAGATDVRSVPITIR